MNESADKLLVEQEFHSLSSLFDKLEDTYSNRLARHALTIGTAMTRIEPTSERIKRVLEFRKLTFSIKEISNFLYHVKIGKELILPYYIIKDGKSKDNTRTFYLFLSDNNRARSVLHTFFKNSKPYFETSILTQEDMFEIIENFRENYSPNLLFVDGTLKIPGETRRTWRREAIPYDPNYLRKIAENENGRWSSIVIRTSDKRIRFRLYEEGIVTLYYGSFTTIWDFIVKPLLRKIDERAQIFKEVEMSAPKDEGLKVLKLWYSEELTKNILNAIRDKLSQRYLTSILHSGNPYLHLEIIDREDFSNLTVFASGNEIEIIPGRSVTVSTLVELVSLILDILPPLRISISEGESYV